VGAGNSRERYTVSDLAISDEESTKVSGRISAGVPVRKDKSISIWKLFQKRLRKAVSSSRVQQLEGVSNSLIAGDIG
jgi:hypothetical protein